MATIKELVEKMIRFHGCYVELRKVGQKYLDSIGTQDEKKVALELYKEIEADIQSIDDSLAFFKSDDAKKMFGDEVAKNLIAKAEKIKQEGGKYCFCEACTSGLELLKRKSEWL